MNAFSFFFVIESFCFPIVFSLVSSYSLYCVVMDVAMVLCLLCCLLLFLAWNR